MVDGWTNERAKAIPLKSKILNVLTGTSTFIFSILLLGRCFPQKPVVPNWSLHVRFSNVFHQKPSQSRHHPTNHPSIVRSVANTDSRWEMETLTWLENKEGENIFLLQTIPFSQMWFPFKLIFACGSLLCLVSLGAPREPTYRKGQRQELKQQQLYFFSFFFCRTRSIIRWRNYQVNNNNINNDDAWATVKKTKLLL